MSTPIELFGWDLLYEISESDLRQKEHVIVLLIHWYLIKSRFRCVGIGDDHMLLKEDKRSELLPTGWSTMERISLRYVHDNQLYILHGIFSEGTAIFNLMKIDGLKVSNAIFKTNETVLAMKGSIKDMIPNYNNVLDNIKRSLLNPVFQVSSKEVETQTLKLQYHDHLDPFLGPSARRLLDYNASTNPIRTDVSEFVRDIHNAAIRDLNTIGPYPIRSRDFGSGVYDPYHPNLRPRSESHPGLISGGIGRNITPAIARFDAFESADTDVEVPRTTEPSDSDLSSSDIFS